MTGTVEIHLFGSLQSRNHSPGQNPEQLPLEHPVSIRDLLQRLDIRAERVQLVMVNHRSVSPQTRIRQGDRVALFPPEYPIFVDWDSHRLKRGL